MFSEDDLRSNGFRALKEVPTNISVGIEFVLTHDGTNKQAVSNDNKANEKSFMTDFEGGRFWNIVGCFVAYWKGLLIGFSSDGEKLLISIGSYRGFSSVEIFVVTEEIIDIENNIFSSGRSIIKV